MDEKKIFRMLLILILLSWLWDVGKTGGKQEEYVTKKEFAADNDIEVKAVLEDDGEKTLETLQECEATEYEGEYIDAKNMGVRENIVGYTFMKTTGDMWYSRDPDYLFPEELVGRGVYVSEHLCEAEVFLGQKLIELLVDRGEIRTENRQYYTDWAVKQLGETNWSLLDKRWKPELFAYNRNYRLAELPGMGRYMFHYYFDPRQESMIEAETQGVSIDLLVDEDGVICGINIDIMEIKSEDAGIEESINYMGLYDGWYSETIIRDGSMNEGSIMLDFSIWHQRRDEVYEPQEVPDAVISAGNIAEMFIDVLESRGEHATQYRERFDNENDYIKFLNRSWKQLGEDWRSGGKYDCEYMDYMERTGCVFFRYYFYPDYEKMETEHAKAVILDCRICGESGNTIDYTMLQVFYLSREEYKSGERQKKVQVVDSGKVEESAGDIRVSVPQTKAPHVLLSKYTLGKEDDAGVKHVRKEIWGYSNLAALAGYLGEKLMVDIGKEDGIEYGFYRDVYVSHELESFLGRAGEGWYATKDYDCFWMKENERAGCIQLRYYFYPPETGNEREWVLVLDVFVSEDGIEDMDVNSFVRKAGCRLF